jgi:hypothetical protein
MAGVALAERLGVLNELGRALLIDRHRWWRLAYNSVRQDCRQNADIRIVHPLAIFEIAILPDDQRQAPHRSGPSCSRTDNDRHR